MKRLGRQEVVRIGLLLLLSLWWAAPLFKGRLIGGGDSVWYHHQVADAVSQFRSGQFPVFVGQTAYAFNGAIHPLRTAPYCQYLAGVLDLTTGRRLTFQQLLNGTAVVSLVGGALAAYLALVWIAPSARWRAFALAVVYLGTPGVLGLLYAQDLYMSTMALPWVPLVFAGALLTFRDPGAFPAVVLGASLGALWWAHSPIAIWTTLAVMLMFVLEALSAVRKGGAARMAWLMKAFAAGASAGVFACYPVVSVLSLRSSGERIVPKLIDRQGLLNEIQGVFPQILLPLDGDKPLLTFIQPGYATLLVLILAGVIALVHRRGSRASLFALLLIAAGYLVIILPMPGITAGFWRHLPETLVNVTNLWPMQRFCIIIAAASCVALQAGLHESSGVRKRVSRVASCGVIVAAAWTILEGGELRSLAQQRTRPEDESQRIGREENANLSEYGYQQLPHRPAYFIHGVADPSMELRLLDPGSGRVLTSNKAAVEASAESPWHTLSRTRTPNPSLFVLAPEIKLHPGRRYLLTFEFAQENTPGVLRLRGTSMDRVYILPSAGDPKGFGSGEDQEKSLVLWTSQTSEPDRVRMEWIADPPAPVQFGRARLTEIMPEQLPVRLTSLVPLRLVVRASAASVLETMRVYIPGWSATVNGRAVDVERSSEGLVALRVPAGECAVEVRYQGPWMLKVAFWLNAAAGVIGIGWMGLRTIQKFRRPGTSLRLADRGSAPT